MKRIPKEEDRLITFSKRRFGIYNKASELSTLCGEKVGVLVFSRAGKAFSFGHPSIEIITNKVLCENPPLNDGTLNLVEAHRRFRLNELQKKYSELLSKMEVAKEQEKISRKKKYQIKVRVGGKYLLVSLACMSLRKWQQRSKFSISMCGIEIMS